MAKVPLSPIGRPRDAFLDDASFAKNRASMRERDGVLTERRAKVADGWGPEYLARVHQKKKLGHPLGVPIPSPQSCVMARTAPVGLCTRPTAHTP